MSFATDSIAGVAGLLGLDGGGKEASPFWFINRIEAGLPLAALDHLSGLVAPSDSSFRFRVVPKASLARRTTS